MKKLIILALILAAGLTAYPQSSRSSREAKSNKGSSSQVSRSSSSKSNSNSAKKAGTTSQSKAKATTSRSSNASSAANRNSGSSRSASSKATQSRSSAGSSSNAVKSGSSNSRSAAVKSGNNNSGSSQSARSSSSSSRSSGAVRSGNTSSRSSGASQSGNTSSRSKAGTMSNNRSGQVSSRSGSGQSDSRGGVRSSESSVNRDSRSGSSSVKTGGSNNRSAESRGNSSSYNRGERKGQATYVRNDGREFRHQNNEVFSRNRYRVDYRDTESLRRSRDFVRVHDHYYNWYNHRNVRRVVIHNNHYHPLSIEIRRVRYPYRVPVYLDLCWTPHLHQSFMYYYPLHNNWNRISYGDYIETASSYEAASYAGTVKRVYGKVEEVYYSPEDNTYTLYFGDKYPYHDFSVVVPKNVAKSFSWSPSWYFEDEHVWAVGLIEMWEGKPEIVLHDEQQIRRY